MATWQLLFTRGGAPRIVRNSILKRFQSSTGAAASGSEVATANAAAGGGEMAPKLKLRTKAYNYLRNIYLDYREAGLDTMRSANEKPFKALAYGLLMTAACVFYKKNPTRRDYENELIELGNELIMCGEAKSARANYYLGEINKLANMGLIEHRSFLFFSLILIRKFNESDCNYESRCAALLNPNKFNVFNVPNLTLRALSRVLDVGFCGQWMFLGKHFRDYDVNEREWIGKK